LILVRERLVELAELLVGGGAVGKGTRPVRTEAQRLAAVAHGLLVVAAEIKGHTAVGPRLGIVGLEPDRLVVIGDSALHSALAGVDDATQFIGFGILRLELDRR